jgi:hypothetical protein
MLQLHYLNHLRYELDFGCQQQGWGLLLLQMQLVLLLWCAGHLQRQALTLCASSCEGFSAQGLEPHQTPLTNLVQLLQHCRRCRRYC